jgi:hypothetical protein
VSFFSSFPVLRFRHDFPVHGEDVTIEPLELQVFIALADKDERTPPERARLIPALIDTGSNDTLSVTKKHVTKWAGRSLNAFPFQKHIRVNTASGELKQIPKHDGDIWLYSPAAPLFKIELSGGFTYYEEGGPRLPLIGASALQAAGLELIADYKNFRFSLRQPLPKFGDYLRKKRLINQGHVDRALLWQREARMRLCTGLDRFFQQQCDGDHAGKTFRQIAAVMDPTILPDGHDIRFPFGEALVAIGAVGRERMLAELEEFHKLQAQFSIPQYPLPR